MQGLSRGSGGVLLEGFFSELHTAKHRKKASMENCRFQGGTRVWITGAARQGSLRDPGSQPSQLLHPSPYPETAPLRVRFDGAPRGDA